MHGQQLLERSKSQNENVIFIFPPSLSLNRKSPSPLLPSLLQLLSLHLYIISLHAPPFSLPLFPLQSRILFVVSTLSVAPSCSMSRPFSFSILPPPSSFLSYVCFVLDHVYTDSSVVTSRIKGLHIFRSAPHGTSEIVRMYMCISSSLAVLTRAFRVHC